jgi:ubiquinone biosynthesis monooxygenase Coq6
VRCDSLDKSLLESISTNDSPTELFNATKITSISGFDGSAWPEITLENEATGDTPTTISCRLVIGADGRNSSVRKAAGILYDGFEYGKSGLVSSLASDAIDGNRAYQRFLTDGPIALLPTSESTYSMVWTLPTKVTKRLESVDDETLTKLINAALLYDQPDISYLLSYISTMSAEELTTELQFSAKRAVYKPTVPTITSILDSDRTRGAYPLRAGTSRYYVDARIALVGDAAHGIHPLAGQGMNLGLGDVECLSGVIGRAVERGEDFGMRVRGLWF